MLSEQQLKDHDSHLNHVIDVLTTVSTTVRQAYPPDDPTNSFVRNATDAINGVQDLRSKLRKLKPPKQNHAATDLDALFQELDQCMLKWNGVEKRKRKNGDIFYNAPGVTHRGFVKICLRQSFMAVYLQIPLNYSIQDSPEMCEQSQRAHGWDTVFRLSSRDNLGYAIELIQQAYNHNLEN